MVQPYSAKKALSFLVDASALRTADLEEYLRADESNIAVLSEVTVFEPYKNRSLTAIGRSLAICCRYPSQLRVLRGTSEIIALEEGGALEPNGYIDPLQTRDSSRFCADLLRAIAGEAPYRHALLGHMTAAREHTARVKEGFEEATEGMRAFGRSFSPASLAAMRRGEPYPEEVLQRSWSFIVDLADSFFQRSYPTQTIRVESVSAFHRLLFRYAVAGTVLALWWARKGGIETVRADRVTNDLIDLQQIALATKYDGLLTRDSKMMEIYSETAAILTIVGESLGAV